MANVRKSESIFFFKIDLPVLFAAFLFAGLIFLYLIPGFEKVMMDGKKKMIHEMTSSAVSLLNYYNSLVSKGELTFEEGQQKAAEAISKIRYGEFLKDYFWITDMHPRMIIHPYRTDLNGKDLTDFLDSRGKQVFVDFVKAVTPEGESYVEYMWQWNDDSTKIVPKLSYVRLYKPWEWIIGTGIYIEDVRLEIRKIEKQALIISGTIGVLLVLLLLVISKQSHKIEHKRKLATDELVRSKELYKTLSEASTEGIIIWTDQGLRANKTLMTLLNYSEPEFEKLEYRDIISSPVIPTGGNASDFYDELEAGLQSESVLKTSDGRPVRSYAGFSRLETGGIKAVITVLRPVRSITPSFEFKTGTNLIDRVQTGFFRISFGSRNRFLFLSAAVAEILGYHDPNLLVNKSIDQFFALPEELKYFKTRLSAREKITGDTLILRKKSGAMIPVIINAEVVETPSGELFCEGTIEHLPASTSGNLITDIYSYAAGFILGAPVSLVARPVLSCPGQTPLGEAVEFMKYHGYCAVMINDQQGQYVGSISLEKAASLMASGVSPRKKVSEHMDSLLPSVKFNTCIYKIPGLLEEFTNNCLTVSDEDDNITGMLTFRDIAGALSGVPERIKQETAEAASAEQLYSVYLKSRDTAVRMLQSGADPSLVTLFLSETADQICSKAIEICSEEMEPPPCRFAFIQTGSAGRKEQSLVTDQDNAIIYEDSDEALEKQAHEYFVRLGGKINTMLDRSGFKSCKGNNMAGNPAWCQPLKKWKDYFSGWIKTPGPDELLEVSIFFDFRFTAGHKLLADSLRTHVNSGIITTDIFFHHLTNAWKPFQPSASSIAYAKVDLKRLIMPLTGMVRLYALKYGTDALSTTERLRILYRDGHIDYRLMSSLLRAWKNLTAIRILSQASAIKEGREPDNTADLRSHPELKMQAEDAIDQINTLMLKAYNDFHTGTD